MKYDTSGWTTTESDIYYSYGIILALSNKPILIYMYPFTMIIIHMFTHSGYVKVWCMLMSVS